MNRLFKYIQVPQPCCPGKNQDHQLNWYILKVLTVDPNVNPSTRHTFWPMPYHQWILHPWPRRRAGNEGHRSRNRRRKAPDSCGGRPPWCHSMWFQLSWPDHLESSSLGLKVARRSRTRPCPRHHKLWQPGDGKSKKVDIGTSSISNQTQKNYLF